MASASKLGKSYNANSAWKSLGTDLSAYDKSYLPNTLATFRELSIPGFSEYTISGPRQSPAYDRGAMQSVYNAFSDARSKVNSPSPLGDVSSKFYGMLNNLNQLPQNLNNAALAGKYMNASF